MDTIKTIQSLLTFNGSAHPVMVALTQSEGRLIAAAPDLYEALVAIVRHGELGCVDRGQSYPPGGKKPASQDVFQFPRHMLTEIEAALAKARGEP